MAKKATLRRRPHAEGIPAEETNLTPAERNLLPDPNIVTEDDADFIVGSRRRHQKAHSLDSVLRRYGVERRRPVER